MTTKRFFDRDFAQVCDLAEALARAVDMMRAQVEAVGESNTSLIRLAHNLQDIITEVGE